MCQVFGGLPCESRRTFATRTASGLILRVTGTFNPGPELLGLDAG
jgi:hypothetical protein